MDNRGAGDTTIWDMVLALSSRAYEPGVTAAGDALPVCARVGLQLPGPVSGPLLRRALPYDRIGGAPDVVPAVGGATSVHSHQRGRTITAQPAAGRRHQHGGAADGSPRKLAAGVFHTGSVPAGAGGGMARGGPRKPRPRAGIESVSPLRCANAPVRAQSVSPGLACRGGDVLPVGDVDGNRNFPAHVDARGERNTDKPGRATARISLLWPDTGALAGGFINRWASKRRLLLTIPASLNVLLALGISLAHGIAPLAVLITGLGLVWITVPALEMLPFEFEGITPREVTAISALVVTLSALGFAAGPMITGAVAQFTGSLQAGLVAMSLVSAVGIAAGMMYPGLRVEI